MIQFNKEVLIDILKAYGETTFLERAENVSENELTQMGKLAGNYVGRYNLVDRTIIAGVIEFYEGKEREPKLKRRNLKAYHREAIHEPAPVKSKNIFSRFTKYFKKD